MNFISRVSAANECGIGLATRKQKSYLMIGSLTKPLFMKGARTSLWTHSLLGVERRPDSRKRLKSSLDFPKITDHFQQTSEHPPKIVRRSHERCGTLLKKSEDSRKLPKTFEADPKMSQVQDVLIINELKYCLWDTLESIKPIESGLSGR